MLKFISRDIYTLIIVALVPGMLLAAWGLTTWDEHRLHQQQCATAVEWLDESAQLASRFEGANSMAGIGLWIVGVEAINSPAHGSQLRRGILSSANYHMDYFPNDNPAEPAVLNPRNGLFARDINAGAENLIEHCPETEALLQNAFPMVFEKEDPN